MSVIDYYDRIASSYDSSRFDNSYGQYIDLAEKSILDDWLKGQDKGKSIDLGCGTGRLLDYAMTGVDGSANMLAVAAQKYPGRRLIHANLAQLPKTLNGFDVGICFHVLMHLERPQVSAFLANTAKVIRPGGRLIVDVLSAPRRQLLKRDRSGWHGNTDFTLNEFALMAEPHWNIVRREGIVLLPIHRLPARLRPMMFKVDQGLSSSFLMPYASYYVLELERVQ